jgi:bifunctional UDP-N-acetylglucosamine pyrophosphorylase/glucosamine-1-phosphate N-acetyltransferase
MVPILGKPMVERVMERLVHNGVDDFILVVSPDDRHITHYFQHDAQIEGDVRFVYQVERMGMAHTLQYTAPLITGDFILSACDNLVSEEDVERLLTHWHTARHTMPWPNAILTLMPVEPVQFSKGALVEMEDGWIKRIVEKPRPEEAPSNLYSLPLYCFDTRILEYLPEVPLSSRGEYEIQDAIQRLIDREGHVGGIIIEQRLTLTNASDLLAINRVYLHQATLSKHSQEKPRLVPYAIGPNTQLVTPLHIETGTVIGADCFIGPDVYIEQDCRIGDGVTIQNAVLLRGSSVLAGTTIENQVLEGSI